MPRRVKIFGLRDGFAAALCFLYALMVLVSIYWNTVAGTKSFPLEMFVVVFLAVLLGSIWLVTKWRFLPLLAIPLTAAALIMVLAWSGPNAQGTSIMDDVASMLGNLMGSLGDLVRFLGSDRFLFIAIFVHICLCAVITVVCHVIYASQKSLEEGKGHKE